MTMTSQATFVLDEHLKNLLKRIEEQQQLSSGDKEKLATAKAETKTTFFELLQSISLSNKDELNATDRAKIDSSLLPHVLVDDAAATKVLRWPAVRALEDPKHYRALLGLPQTIEQTRRHLTVIPPQKCKEIMENLSIQLLEARDKYSCGNNPPKDDLRWVEQVLSYLTGDGRLKKDLVGFQLQQQPKQYVREMLNKAKRLRIYLTKESASVNIDSGKASECKETIFIDRDVRLEDEERKSRRVADFASHFESVIEKK